MTSYHPRRPEKVIGERNELLAIIGGQKVMTLALCKDNEPYLATVNYVYDREENCFYFHCAPRGRKVDYLKANPSVWGQVLEDRGYLQGECDHAYRTVQFRGFAEFLSEEEIKRSVLEKLIDAQEEDPGPRRERLHQDRSLNHVGIVRIRIFEMTGKMNPAKKEEVVS